ncbi:FAD/NAD(P)-binding protein [Thalassomonas actiniarum]|uniref:FAD/NAD(P)-binding protein n=1 Tax=Thalassomonas actiniarum TaxID=485447 RepID=A0AAE9YKZ2_9GAMM|nr:FAD/NAD(P)-binding protein [Thalassomonas actiniarum]WDD96588.1 FAD/NAD(P)-binding protein [Thalassomonas actiniarum]
MAEHIPDSIQLLNYIDDGEEARHYRFCLTNTRHHNLWSKVQPGQFFMLYVPGAGEAPFTFTSPPDSKGEFSAFIRKMGKVTGHLFELNPGAVLGARGPFGRGWPMEELNNRDILIIAGGCGLAPLVYLIETLTNSGSKYCNELTLIYGARNPKAQMLSPERLRWQQKIKLYNTFDELSPVATTQPQLINSCQGTPLDILADVFAGYSRAPTVALLCGPEQMMQAAATELVDFGLKPDSVFLSVERRMHCALGLCGHCYIRHAYACKQGPTFSWQALQPLI